MKLRNRSGLIRLGAAGALILLMLACAPTSDSGIPTSPSQAPFLAASPTSTPTSPGAGLPDGTLTPTTSRCEGSSGALEIQVLVGPSEVVGLEPLAVGEIPFSVGANAGVYPVSGNGVISYENTLEQAWGTYTVSFDMDVSMQGECAGASGSEMLDVMVVMSGEQLVEVRAEGFSEDYPWADTIELDLSSPGRWSNGGGAGLEIRPALG